MVFLELSGKVVFFTENMVFFPWMENDRGMTFPKKYMETWYFLFDMFHAALQKKKKNQIRPYPAKIHVKVIDIPDRHPRKSSSNSLYLYERPLQAFSYIAVQQKKKKKKNSKLNI